MVLRHRPTFTIDLADATGAVIDRLRAGLPDPSLELRWSRTPGARGDCNDEHCFVLLCRRKRRFWSPWLHLEVKQLPNATRLFGRFSPHPSLWAGYTLGYLFLAVASFFAVMFAAGQLLSGGRPTLLWVLAPTGAIAVGMWWSSRIGQRLARDEMSALRGRVDEALSATVTPAASSP
jgi:hypothetical protein